MSSIIHSIIETPRALLPSRSPPPRAPSLPLAVPPAEDSLFRSDDKLPGDAFALSTGSIWDIIRSQKDLNLPAHKVGGGGRGGKGGGGGAGISQKDLNLPARKVGGGRAGQEREQEPSLAIAMP